MIIRELNNLNADIGALSRLVLRIPLLNMDGEELIQYLLKVDKLGHLIVGEDADNLVGMIAFYANDIKSLSAYVSTFAVAKDFEGRGAAREIFSHFKDVAIGLGMKYCSLDVVKNNLRAIAFYEKMGLSVCGDGRDAHHFLMKGVLQ